MTDKQQLIIYIQIKNKLADALEYADSNLPKEIDRNLEKHYIGKNRLSALDFNAKNWEQRPTGSPIAFDKLLNLLTEIDDFIEILKEPSEEKKD